MQGFQSRFLIIFLSFVLITNFCYAQKHKKKTAEAQLLTSNNQPIDQLLDKVENVHITLNRINDLTGNGFNTLDIDQNLPRIEQGIRLIKNNLGNGSVTIDVNDLQMYDAMLDAIQEKLGLWKGKLIVDEKELVKMNENMRIFTGTNDSVFKKLAVDTSYRKLFASEMQGLKEKWVKADSSTRKNFSRINTLQANVSSNYFQSIELADRITYLMKEYWVRTLGKEYPYFWERSAFFKKVPSSESADTSSDQQSILNFYFSKSGTKWMLLIASCISLFSFISFQFWKLRKLPEAAEGFRAFRYIRPYPILACLTLFFTAGPFLDLVTPSAYLEILFIALLIVLAITFLKVWPRKLWGCWILTAIFFTVFTLIDSISVYSFSQRITLLGLNIAALLFGVYFRKRTLKMHEFNGFVRFTLILFISMNAAAIIFNLFGRMSQADEFSLAAIYGLIEVFALNTMVHICREFIDLLLFRYRSESSSGASFKDVKIKSLFNAIFLIAMVICWFILLFDNLNILDNALTGLVLILDNPLKLGSLVFTPGNLILFIFIIYLSNLVQKFIGFFMAEGDEFKPEFQKRGSRLAVLRLMLLILGFLFAIAASGLPLDKITILLGALGVGIGLGLQNIVHNLVSGIILIFERPFQIGDLVEIGTRKGRVKDIGIRSSKLITTEGSEVIVPNGDLLSERVVNWTFNNSNVRVEMLVKIGPGSDIELAKKLITDQLNTEENVLKRIPPEVFLNNITDSGIELKVLAWIDNLHQEQSFKSNLLIKIFSSLSQNEIKMT